MTYLFDHLTLREVVLHNRIVVSPMWQFQGFDGFSSDWHVMHLGRFAVGGAGIVFQEGTAVERRGCGTVADIGIWDDKFIPQLGRVARIMEENGTVPGVQLMHAGRKSRMKLPIDGRGQLQKSPDLPDWDAWEPISASPVPLKEGLEPPREMTQEDIDNVVTSFASAARRAAEAGYKALEIHAGHGYLPHQFLSPLTNHRTDGYGGSLNNRMRMTLELTEAVRLAWPSHLPLFIRLSCIDGAGWELEDTIALVKELLPLGVDVVDCSTGGLVGSPLRDGETLHYGYQVKYSRAVREATGARTMAVGLIVRPEHAESILRDGDADLIAIAREVVLNPNWPLYAAVKLGVEDPYAHADTYARYWLRHREESFPGFVSSIQGMH